MKAINRDVRFNFYAAAAMVLAGALFSARAADTPKLVAVKTAAPPSLDGKATEQVWQQAKPLTVTAKRPLPPDQGASVTVRLRAAYTETHIYLLAEWDDLTRNDSSHKTWIWNAEKKAYEEGKDFEDVFAIALELTGEFDANMLSGNEASWDVWQWKAFRTNPQGFAMDRTHHYFKSEPTIKAKKFQTSSGSEVWIARPEDKGDTVEKKQSAPTEHKGDRVPQFLHGMPLGSAADVQAKGEWANGKWTLELARQLNTDNLDDTAFDVSRTYKVAVEIQDADPGMDKASGVIELSFAPSR
jgi:hypothetical protein